MKTDEELRMCQMSHINLPSHHQAAVQPMTISMSLIIKADHRWLAFVSGLCIPSSCDAVRNIPDLLTVQSFIDLVNKLESYNRCVGNPDSRFVSLCEHRKGKFLDKKKNVVSFLHESPKTVRHVDCELIVKKGSRCTVCCNYRSRLRAMCSSFSKSNCDLLNTNHRFLRTPQQKSRILSLRKKCKITKAQNRKLSDKLNKLISSSGVTTDKQLQEDLLLAIDKIEKDTEQLAQNGFQKMFWEQQVRFYVCLSTCTLIIVQVSAAKVEGKQGIRWHPLFIRWCLNIMLSSPKTYNIIRESGVIHLPSTRTLKDYTHWFKPEVGFQNEVFIQLSEYYKVSELNFAKK